MKKLILLLARFPMLEQMKRWVHDHPAPVGVVVLLFMLLALAWTVTL